MLLAIDTSAHLCAVTVYDQDRGLTLGKRVLDIGRGHAEILIGQIEECLDEAECDFSDIDRIGVVNGPGSFTGVRVGLATARALRVALKVDVVGVSSLEANEYAARECGFDGRLMTVVDAKRGQAFCKLSDQPAPFLETYENLAAIVPTDVTAICGSGSALLQQELQRKLAIVHEHAAAPIEVVALLASQADAEDKPPEPLYLRSADAKPQSGFALELA